MGETAEAPSDVLSVARCYAIVRARMAVNVLVEEEYQEALAALDRLKDLALKAAA